MARNIVPYDRHVRRSGEDYATIFVQLLPQGQAWPRDPDSTLYRACRGLADYWGFVDSRAADLLERESDPRYTIELLPDWERNWGLPDPCLPPTPQTVRNLGELPVNNNWAVVHATLDTVAGVDQPQLSRLIEDTFDGAHTSAQSITSITAKGLYQVSLQWKSLLGDTPRGIYFAIEGLTNTNTITGANIWVKPDGSVDTLKSVVWGAGIKIETVTNTVNNGWWNTVLEINVVESAKLTLNALHLNLIGTDDDTPIADVEYLGDGASGIEYYGLLLATVDKKTVPVAQSIGERQRMLVKMMTWVGGQSRQYFIDLMKWFGYTITIKEFAPFMAGISQVGDTRPLAADGINVDTSANFRWYIGPPELRFYWTIEVGQLGFIWFRAGSGQAGVDHHLEFRVPQELQCLLNRWKPAHTEIVLDFSQAAFGGPMQGTP